MSCHEWQGAPWHVKGKCHAKLDSTAARGQLHRPVRWFAWLLPGMAKNS